MYECMYECMYVIMYVCMYVRIIDNGHVKYFRDNMYTKVFVTNI